MVEASDGKLVKMIKMMSTSFYGLLQLSARAWKLAGWKHQSVTAQSAQSQHSYGNHSIVTAHSTVTGLEVGRVVARHRVEGGAVVWVVPVP